MSSSSGFVPATAEREHPEFRAFESGPSQAGEAHPKDAAPRPTGSDPTAREAYDRGLAEGLATGREEGARAARDELPIADLDALKSATSALSEAARGVAALREGYLLENRKIVVELAIAMAGRILRREVAADPEALVGIVERALAALGDAPPVALHLAPEDAGALLAGSAPGLSALAEQHGFSVEADARLRAGDARVLAERTAVDARLERTLRRIGEEWTEIAERAHAEPAKADAEPANAEPAKADAEPANAEPAKADAEPANAEPGAEPANAESDAPATPNVEEGE